MSTEIVVALIGLLGVLLAPVVKTAVEKNRPGRAGALQMTILVVVVGLLLLLSAAAGLWRQRSPEAIDLGSAWDVRDGRIVSDLTADQTVIYHHTTTGKLRYRRAIINDTLMRVNRVCRLGRSDITYLFTRTNLGDNDLPEYESGIIELDSNCTIEFVVRNTSGNDIGIDLLAEPVR